MILTFRPAGGGGGGGCNAGAVSPALARSAAIAALPNTARPIRQVRPTTLPSRFLMALMRCSVRSMPALLSPPNCPACKSFYILDARETPASLNNPVHAHQARGNCSVGWIGMFLVSHFAITQLSLLIASVIGFMVLDTATSCRCTDASACGVAGFVSLDAKHRACRRSQQQQQYQKSRSGPAASGEYRLGRAAVTGGPAGSVVHFA